MQEIMVSNLSGRDLELLKSLGIKLPKEKSVKEKKRPNPLGDAYRKATRNTCPDEYYLKVIRVCTCCSTILRREGKMTQKGNNSYLSFVAGVIPQEEIYMTKTLETLTCGKCQEELLKMDKETLVKKILALKRSER